MLLLGVEVLPHRRRRAGGLGGHRRSSGTSGVSVAVGRVMTLASRIDAILALDTTTRAGSVRSSHDDRVVARAAPAIASRTHGERLPARARCALLDAAGVALDDVDLFAVAAGPGSFTGLRIGIATMQGLAFAHGQRVVAGVGARGAGRGARRRRAERADRRVDGRAARRSVRALYARRRTRRLVAAGVGARRPTMLDAWRDCSTAGDADRSSATARSATATVDRRDARRTARRSSAPPPLLAGVDRPDRAPRAATRAVLPHAIVPLYVRRPDAELARDAPAVAGADGA